MPINFETYQPQNAFPALGSEFCDPVSPATWQKETIRWRNNSAAARLGLESLNDQEWLAHLARFEMLPDTEASNGLDQPYAMRYHGHQFQSYNPDIGDGRGFLFAQAIEKSSGKLLDLGTKGSGQTPFSRAGDGRLTLKGGVREVLAAEMLEALGVKTSQALSLVETGEELERHDEPSPTRGAVLVRLQESHVRFGSFQRHAFERAPERIEALLDHCLTWYYPDQFGDLATVPTADKVQAFLRCVSKATADLVAQWMIAGFVHGVLNTDNMVVTGESFDYGPYRFLPVFEPGFTAAYFDHSGLYAYGRQPDAVAWNLSRLAGCFIPLGLESQALSACLDDFGPRFQACLQKQFFWRLGRAEPKDQDAAEELMGACFKALQASQIPPHVFFHYGATDQGLKHLGEDFDAAKPLLSAQPSRLNGLLPTEPVGLLYDEIEAIWALIDQSDDWSAFDAKIADIRGLAASLHAAVK